MANQAQSLARRPPECIAILVCNEVIEDKFTNNKTVVGIFNTIATQVIPFTHTVCVMISFSEGIGEWPITFRIVAPSKKEIIKIQGAVTFDDRKTVADLVFRLDGMPITEEGVHIAEVLVENELGRRRHFSVLQIKKG